MIVLKDVWKRYRTEHGHGKWVLHSVTLDIPGRCNVGLIGQNGAGKSTLLRLIGGIDQPSRGIVERRCRASWPLGLTGGLQGSLTGRQNAKFVCRLFGEESQMQEKLAFISDFSELGAAFDEPIKTYSSGMGARLRFSLSLAFDFDVYLVDELTAVGDAAFKKKSKMAFEKLAGRAGLIMASHDERGLQEFCQAGIWLHQGQARWFDDIGDAIASYKQSRAA